MTERTERMQSCPDTLEVVQVMKEWLDKHEEEEREIYREIKADIMKTREDSEKRHDATISRLEQLSKSTLAVVNEQNRALKEIHALFKSAFPDGNGEAHRLAHEKWIKKAEQEEEFWMDVKKKVVGWAAVAIIGWVGIAIWAAFLRGPGDSTQVIANQRQPVTPQPIEAPKK